MWGYVRLGNVVSVAAAVLILIVLFGVALMGLQIIFVQWALAIMWVLWLMGIVAYVFYASARLRVMVLMVLCNTSSISNNPNRPSTPHYSFIPWGGANSAGLLPRTNSRRIPIPNAPRH